MKGKKTKLIKGPKIIFQKPKTLEKPNILDIKPVIMKHPKTSRKLFKTIKQVEKVSQVVCAGRKSDSFV